MKLLKSKKIIIIILIIMLVSNIPPLKNVISLFMDEGYFRYSNGNGSVTFCEIPFKRRFYNLSPIVPQKFIQLNPNSSDTIIYRLFWKNPVAFWRWGEYFYDKRYKLPYKIWGEIRKRRGYDLKYSNNWQDF
jgi:hypothetical protein